MEAARPSVVLAAHREVYASDISAKDVDRLRGFAEFRHAKFDRPSSWEEPPAPDAATDRKLIELVAGADALVVSHGAPRISAQIMDACPSLRFIGELEGDRFAQRIDVEAAWQRGIRTVDTTNGTSYGVSEWALALALIGLRNAGDLYRRMVVGRQERFHPGFLDDRGYRGGELGGKTVGLIGCGIIGRRLLELLAPFHCPAFVHDPYVPRELADIYDVTLTSLDKVMSLSDVVFCLAPITPATRGMLGVHEFALMRDDAVFVNVSRGAVVQSEALISELQSGRITAALDVFDPEPMPAGSPMRDLPNVFLSPHIGGVTPDSRRRLFALMVDELERFFAGHETRYDLLPSTIANRTGQPPDTRR
ncbi:MAG: hydroxyacid dehydrogenase [Chloroflexota bacterium]